MNQSERDERLMTLNDRLAEALLARVTSGEASAQELNVARQYLKDNNLSALITEFEGPAEDSPILQLAGEIQREMNEQDQATG